MVAKLIRIAALVVTLVVSTSAVAQTPPVPPPAPGHTAAQIAAQQQVAAAFAAGPTLQGAGVTATLLQVVAQVVVDRATESAWAMLKDKLKSSLQCDHEDKDKKKDTRFPKTCKVLDTVRIQDIIGAPRTLLDAALADLAAIVKDRVVAFLDQSKPLKYAVEITVGIAGFLTLWSDGKQDGALATLTAHLQASLQEAVGTTCPTSDDALPLDLRSAQAGWVIGMCLVDNPTGPPPANQPLDVPKRLKQCKLADEVAKCAGANDETLTIARNLQAALTSSSASDAAVGIISFASHGAATRLRKAPATPAPAGTVDPCFAASDTKHETNVCALLVEDAEAMSVGVIRQDWNKVTVGAVSALKHVGDLGGSEVSGTKFYRLLAAIGQYALTYDSGTGAGAPEAVTKARRDVIESLLKDTVSRDERRGWVLSLGGSFGLGGMYRRAIGTSATGTTDSGASGPFILPLGLGLQYYRSEDSTCGLHLQLGLFDLGQYVTFEDNHDVTVGEPDPKAAIALSITAGVWFGSRSVPIFVGPYFGFAPFVLADGRPEVFIGGMLGAYVPIFDF